jgi:hypothetical protein
LDHLLLAEFRKSLPTFIPHSDLPEKPKNSFWGKITKIGNLVFDLLRGKYSAKQCEIFAGL